MRTPLKIIIYDGSFDTTAFINRLAKGLALRHNVYILGFNEELTHRLERVHYVPLGSNQSKFRFVMTSLSYAIESKSLKMLFSTLKMLFNGERQELQKQDLRFILKKIEPDIIHLQWPSVIPWFEEVLKAHKIPVVLSQRGSQNNVRPFVEEDTFFYMQQWYPKINGFHSVSKAISINGDKIWCSPKKLDKVIYTGLPLQNLPFRDEYIMANSLQLLSVGRTYWIKGYDYALQTCKILKEKNINFHYTVIGGAGDEELQFLISDLDLNDCVSLMGRMPQEEVFKKMREASLLLMSSIEEGIPNVAVEAMAIGLPVLSTNCGGVSELIDDGVEGWIVPIRDSVSMAEGVVSFYHLPLDKINEVRIAARKKVELQHSEEKMLRNMEELYLEIISNFVK